MSTLRSRHLRLIASGKAVAELVLTASDPPQPIEFSFLLKPGRNSIRFETDSDGEVLPNGDPRRLAFCLRNFKVLE